MYYWGDSVYQIVFYVLSREPAARIAKSGGTLDTVPFQKIVSWR